MDVSTASRGLGTSAAGTPIPQTIISTIGAHESRQMQSYQLLRPTGMTFCRIRRRPRSNGIAGVTAIAAAAALFAASYAQNAVQQTGSSAPESPIYTEKLIAPHLRRQLTVHHPAPDAGREGWVNVGMMVDATGKPYELTVIASAGDKDFERAAPRAIADADFVPGMDNGKPIESAAELKIVFHIRPDLGPPTASRGFIEDFDSLRRAVKSKDRTAADAAMGRLVVTNLYEDAYYGLAQHLYTAAWGDTVQQLAGLRRAIAYESVDEYLPKQEFQWALLQTLVLDISSRDYDDALDVWEKLQKMGAEPGILEKLKPKIEGINALRASDAAYDIAASLPDGSWRLGLFKQNFRLTTQSGHITGIKLRRERGFVQFAFDPTLQYMVESHYGTCKMQLEGEPGTKFTLTQF
jgi:TonB family protein